MLNTAKYQKYQAIKSMLAKQLARARIGPKTPFLGTDKPQLSAITANAINQAFEGCIGEKQPTAKAAEPKGSTARERRAALLFHHAVYYDTPDKETVAILTEALAAIASEPQSEGLEKSIQKAIEKAD